MYAENTPIMQVRLKTLDEAPAMGGFFFKDGVKPVPEELIQKKMTASDALLVAQRATEVIKSLSDVALQTIEEPLRALVDELEMKPGQIFGVIRVAVTGQRVSPPLFESMEVIGREAVLARLEQAIGMLKELAAKEE